MTKAASKNAAFFVAVDTNKRILRLSLFDRRSFGNDIVYKN